LKIFALKFAYCLLSIFSAASIYPGRGGPGESGFYPSHDLDCNQALSDDEDIQEDENDWMGDTDLPTKSTQKHPSKFSESIATEVSLSDLFTEVTVTLLNSYCTIF
jgi:hypothetical protein